MSGHDTNGRVTRPATDLDRLLGEWLADGPSRAPEAPLATAIQHTRSHPRRRDPLAPFRADPMGGRSYILGLSGVPAFAVLALLLVAALGVALVGAPRLLPPPPVTPTANPTATPSTAPTAVPTTRPLPTPIVAEIEDLTGRHPQVRVDDASGLVIRAGSQTPSDGGVVAGDTLAITNVDERTLRLEWTDLPCASTTGYDVQVDAAARVVTVSRDACGGDTLPIDRILTLTFSQPIDAAAVTGTVDLPISGQ